MRCRQRSSWPKFSVYQIICDQPRPDAQGRAVVEQNGGLCRVKGRKAAREHGVVLLEGDALAALLLKATPAG